jgi:hypothetical protein
MTRIYQVSLSKPHKVQGARGEVTASTAYILGNSFEEALGKFRATYPDASDTIRGVSLVDYCNGFPVIE